jgi:hypothetical protein
MAGVGTEDFYRVLDISASSKQSDIRTAYRRLAMRYHPVCLLVSSSSLFTADLVLSSANFFMVCSPYLSVVLRCLLAHHVAENNSKDGEDIDETIIYNIQGDTRPTGAVPPRLPVSVSISATLAKCSALLKGDGSQ